jgi:hypothetical protein
MYRHCLFAEAFLVARSGHGFGRVDPITGYLSEANEHSQRFVI